MDIIYRMRTVYYKKILRLQNHNCTDWDGKINMKKQSKMDIFKECMLCSIKS